MQRNNFHFYVNKNKQVLFDNNNNNNNNNNNTLIIEKCIKRRNKKVVVWIELNINHNFNSFVKIVCVHIYVIM